LHYDKQEVKSACLLYCECATRIH